MSKVRAKARFLLAAPVILDGVDAMRNPDPHAEKIVRAWGVLQPLGVPAINHEQARRVARISGALYIGAGVTLASGRAQRPAATALAASIIPLSIANCSSVRAKSWQERRDSTRSLLNYGILFGGLTFAALDRQGRPSHQWKRDYQLRQREAAKALATS